MLAASYPNKYASGKLMSATLSQHSHIICRNPTAMQRPGFRNILLALLEDEEQTLSIPPRDVGSNSLAVVLGAPLDGAFNMYTELQTKYYHEITSSL